VGQGAVLLRIVMNGVQPMNGAQAMSGAQMSGAQSSGAFGQSYAPQYVPSQMQQVTFSTLSMSNLIEVFFLVMNFQLFSKIIVSSCTEIGARRFRLLVFVEIESIRSFQAPR